MKIKKTNTTSYVFLILGATDDHGRNTLRISNTFLHFLFTTSKEKRDYGTYELTRKLEIMKDQENLKTSENYNLVPSISLKMKTLLILLKNC